MTVAELDFLLDQFAETTPQLTHAVAVSADGLLIARSRHLPVDQADRVAAVACGLVSLLRSAAGQFGAGEMLSNLTELQGGFMFTACVGSGASLLVMAGPGCDIGRVSHALAELINKVGAVLTPPVRAAVADAGTR